MKYHLIHSPLRDEFVAMVNLKISEGWIPIGGVAIVRIGESSHAGFNSFHQAMVLPDLPQSATSKQENP